MDRKGSYFLDELFSHTLVDPLVVQELYLWPGIECAGSVRKIILPSISILCDGFRLDKFSQKLMYFYIHQLIIF